MLFRMASRQLFARVTGKAGVVVSQPSRSVVSSVLLPNSPTIMNHSDVGGVGTVATTTPPFPYHQVRSFSKKYKNKGGGGSPKDSGSSRDRDRDRDSGPRRDSGPPKNSGNVFKVYPVWGGPEEIATVEEYADAELIPASSDFSKVKRGLASAHGFDDDRDMKIYNSSTKDFDILVSVDQLQKEQNKRGKVYISQDEDDGPDFGGGEDEDEEDYGEEYDGYNPRDEVDSKLFPLRETLVDVVERLKHENWTRGENGIMEKDGTRKPTKEVVVQLAAGDIELQNTLIEKVGVLDHIATCVHYDFVWDHESDVDGGGEGGDDMDDDSDEDKDTAGMRGRK